MLLLVVLLLPLDCFNIFAVFLPLPFGRWLPPPSPLSAGVLLDGKLPRLRAVCEHTMSTAVFDDDALVLAALRGGGGGSSCRLNSVRHNCVHCLLLLLSFSHRFNARLTLLLFSNARAVCTLRLCVVRYRIYTHHIRFTQILGVRANCGKVSFGICVFIYVLLLLFQLFFHCCSFCPSHFLPFHCSFCLNFHRVLFLLLLLLLRSLVYIFLPRFRFHFLSFFVLLVVCAQFSVRPTLKLNIKRNERPKVEEKKNEK